jgi:hypothetical protein
LQKVFLSNGVACHSSVFSFLQHITELCWFADGAAWMQDVLPVLPQLQQLQDLELQQLLGEAAAEDYTALTAITQLRRLDLQMCWMEAGAAQYMFGAGQVLPYLTKLVICPHELWPENSFECEMWEAGPQGLLKQSLGVGPADVAQLVRCCPVLQELRMLALLDDVTVGDLAPLLQLTGLTHLGIGGAGCTYAVAEQLLPKRTGE